MAEVQAGGIGKQNCTMTQSTFLLFQPFQQKKKKQLVLQFAILKMNMLV
jgi:hypothetical protein